MKHNIRRDCHQDEHKQMGRCGEGRGGVGWGRGGVGWGRGGVGWGRCGVALVHSNRG